MRRLGDVCQDICRELRRGGGLSHRMPTRSRTSYPLRFQVQVFAKSQGRCYYCGGGADVMDHVVPVSSGGRDAFDNLVPACWRCICGKGGRSVEQYRNSRARADPEIPDFTEKQLRWLARQGIALPAIPVYRFWFEEQGLRIGKARLG